ncbi:MAG: amidohydrolase [Candidatus Cloacimonetes bacterium]|nr:amidohydrolase [Candidatus Cloacimonadota bacterium]
MQNGGYLFHNGEIITLEPDVSPDALLTGGNTILATGSLQDMKKLAPPGTELINLRGNVLLPAFTDTHTHFFEYAHKPYEIDLWQTTSLKDVEAVLQNYKKKMSEDIAWIGGNGWDLNLYPDSNNFNKHFIDIVFPDIPVAIKSKDLHSLLLNTAALRESGIDASTPQPPGGSIGLFPDGSPNGFLYESALLLARKQITDLSEFLQRKALRQAIRYAHRVGLAAIHIMEDVESYQALKKLQKNGNKLRVCWHFPSKVLNEMIAQGITSYTGSEMMKIGGVKLFMDGSIGSHTAYMYDPYPGSYNYCGRLILTPRKLYETIHKAAISGIASSIHAIGDRCCHIVAQTIARVNYETGSKLPHRIEHLQCVRPEDLDIIQQNGIYAALQPVHIKTDVYTIKKNWPTVEQFTYPFREMLNRKLALGFGSDAPVETLNPFAGIYAALERKYDNNPDEPSWMPSQKLTIMEALHGYTLGAARGSCSEHIRGSLKAGKLADMIVIENFRNQPNEFWLKAESLLTMVDGEIVYEAEKVR